MAKFTIIAEANKEFGVDRVFQILCNVPLRIFCNFLDHMSSLKPTLPSTSLSFGRSTRSRQIFSFLRSSTTTPIISHKSRNRWNRSFFRHTLATTITVIVFSMKGFVFSDKEIKLEEKIEEDDYSKFVQACSLLTILTSAIAIIFLLII